MSNGAITRKEAESAIQKVERTQLKQKAMKLQTTQTLAVLGGSALRGLLKAKTTVYTYQAGGFAFADLAMVIGGAVLGLGKSGKKAALGMGVMYAGLSPIGEALGTKGSEALP